MTTMLEVGAGSGHGPVEKRGEVAGDRLLLALGRPDMAHSSRGRIAVGMTGGPATTVAIWPTRCST